MSSAYSFFLRSFLSFFDDNTSDPSSANDNEEYENNVRYNVKTKKLSNIILNNGDTFPLTIPGEVSTDWRLLYMKVIGEVEVETTSTLDGAGYLRAYGNILWPGIFFLSSTDNNSVTIRGKQDGTVVTFYYALSEEDS